MDKDQFTAALNDRLLRYGATPLDPARSIAITADAAYLGSFDGQIAAIVACNLLARLSPNVTLGFSDAAIRSELPFAGQSLHAFSLDAMRAMNPYGEFRSGVLADGDFRFHLGPAGAPEIVHGSGWNAYVGPGPSPLRRPSSPNGIGAALAVILAAAGLFRTRLASLGEEVICNAWDWTPEIVSAPASPAGVACGHVMTVGAGSVGSAANYFLVLITRNFSATLIDHDGIKIWNLTRSPIFVNDDVDTNKKVEAVATFLRAAGVTDLKTDDVALHESPHWTRRSIGTPDVLIATANEFNVRYQIEMLFPPVQLYATTGRNWQTTLMRHMPGAASCSMCEFPPEQNFAPTTCATDAPARPDIEERRPDAALPFLSFAAGLMTAAEIFKLGMPRYPFAPEKVSLYLKAKPLLIGTPISHRPGCLCGSRNQEVHKQTIAGSQYAAIGRW